METPKQKLPGTKNTASQEQVSNGLMSRLMAWVAANPFIALGIVASLPVLLLLAFTFKSAYVPSHNKNSKSSRLVVVRPLVEIVDEATAALQKNDLQTFSDLLDHELKDNINVVNSKGDTLLLVAATLGNAQAVNQLVLSGADVNKTSSLTKDTPLLRALYYSDNTDIARLLVYAGADINAKNSYHHTPLFLALEKKRGELIDLFLSSGVKEGLSTDYLFRAVGQKNNVGVLAMLKGGIDPNVANEKGNTPLIIAASLGDLPSVETLLAYRADVNAANKDGNTALMYAARYNHPAVVRELLKPQTMQAPIEIDAQNKNGQTALYLAASKGNEAIVRRLLAENADPTIAAKDGLVPYAIAQKRKRDKVLPWFEKSFLEVKNSVVEDDNKEMIARAKAEGYDIPEEDKNAKPITDEDIFKAAKEGDLELARRVVAMNKAVVFDKNKEGDTALLVAVANGHTKMVDYLLDNFARMFEASAKGNIFHVAVKAQNLEMLKHIVQRARQEGRLSMMLEYKASPAGRQQAMTPLGFAALDCNKEIYDYLISIGAKPGVRNNSAPNMMGFKSPADLIEECKSKPATAKTLKPTK